MRGGNQGRPGWLIHTQRLSGQFLIITISHLGLLIFEEYAIGLAKRVSVRAWGNMLEIASYTDGRSNEQ